MRLIRVLSERIILTATEIDSKNLKTIESTDNLSKIFYVYLFGNTAINKLQITRQSNNMNILLPQWT